MKILIVHDRPNAAEKICGAIRGSVDGDPIIDVANDCAGARKFMSDTVYDVAIIDLTLPHINGSGQTSYQHAENLLDEILILDEINTPGDVIGVSADPDAIKVISTKLSSKLMGVVAEDDGGKWLDCLLDRINYLKRSADARYKAAQQTFEYDALIVTAMDEEFQPYHGLFELYPVSSYHGVYEFLFTDALGIARKGIAYSIGRQGQHSAASMTQSLVTRFRPRLCLMSGICGVVEDKGKLGDIIIFENVFDWDCGKWKMDADGQARFYARVEPIGLRGMKAHDVGRELVRRGLSDSNRLTRQAIDLTGGDLKQIRVKLAPAASGSSVVADTSIIARMKGINENITGVDMEAYGMYYACKFSFAVNPDFICIKAASDFCSPEKDDKYHPVSCLLSAESIKEVLTKLWKF